VGDGALGFWKALRKVFSRDARATLLRAGPGQETTPDKVEVPKFTSFMWRILPPRKLHVARR